MSSNSKFILILSGVFLIVVLVGVGGFLLIQNLQPSSGSPQGQRNENMQIRNLVNDGRGGNVPSNNNRNQELPPPPTNSPVATGAELIALARSFSERYGSYSTNNAFQNLRDLKLFMTDRLWKESEKMMATGSSSDGYFGVTSRALQVEREDDSLSDMAKLKVTLQRTESKGQTAPRVYYQSVSLQMRQEGGVWLVDEVQWRKEL